MGNEVSKVGNWAVGAYNTSVKFLKDSWDWFVDLLQSMFTGIVDGFKGIFDGIKDIVEKGIKDLRKEIEKQIKNIIDGLNTTLYSIINPIKDEINSVLNTLKSYIDTLNNAITSAYKAFIDTFVKFGKIISSFFSELGNSISEIFNVIVRKMNDILTEIGNTFIKVFNSFNDLADLLKKGGESFIGYAKDLIDTYLLSYLNFIGSIGKSLLAESDQNDTSFINCMPCYIYNANSKFSSVFGIGFIPTLYEIYLKKMHVNKKPQCGVLELNDTSFSNCYPVYTNTLNNKYDFISDGDTKINLLNEVNKKPQCSETTINFILGNIETSALTIVIIYISLLMVIKSLFSLSPLVEPSPMFEPVIPPEILAVISVYIYMIHVSTAENRKPIKNMNDNIIGFVSDKILPIVKSVIPNNMMAVICTLFIMIYVSRKIFNYAFPE